MNVEVIVRVYQDFKKKLLNLTPFSCQQPWVNKAFHFEAVIGTIVNGSLKWYTGESVSLPIPQLASKMFAQDTACKISPKWPAAILQCSARTLVKAEMGTDIYLLTALLQE